MLRVFNALWETAAESESITLIISASLYAACAFISFIDLVVIIRISHLCYFPIMYSSVAFSRHLQLAAL